MENKLTASELRIGNLVEYEGEIYEIDTISKLFPTLNTVAFGIGLVGWDNLNPIPLNEEWFLKLGFNYKNVHGRIEIYSLGMFSFRKSKYSRGLTHRKLGSLKNNIKYVHQLQNLYFALTNEELTIK